MHILMQLYIGSLYDSEIGISNQNNYEIVENVQLNVATEKDSSSACCVHLETMESDVHSRQSTITTEHAVANISE